MEGAHTSWEHVAVQGRRLLVNCTRLPQHGDPTLAVVFLHGFPDLGVHPHHPTRLASRHARKLCDGVLQAMPTALFVAFNSSGLPGSDQDLPFRRKRVSLDVQDAVGVALFAQGRVGGAVGPGSVPRVHVVGISTGAIVGALLRDPRLWEPHGVACPLASITAIAGLANTRRGVAFDFSPEQLRAMHTLGWCHKEFWVPRQPQQQPQQRPGDLDQADSDSGSGWERVEWAIERAYTDEFEDGKLDVQGAVAKGSVALLVVHGELDHDVPLENGQELFDAAAHPKSLVVVRKGNHLLTNSSHMKKTVRALVAHIQAHVPAR